MSKRILLLTPARRFIANRFGVGYQIPLGLVLLGGPLVDAGHTVRLIDNDLYGFQSEQLVQEIAQFAPDCIMLGHTGSTAAHTTCVATAEKLRMAFPDVKLVYGGVYPSYAHKDVLQECPAIDVVVRGEGEATVVDLMEAWETKRSLAEVEGITWREGKSIRMNRARPPIQCLDAYRPGWELVDWSGYELFGMGRSAGMQFSRGCTLTCTYCGQWAFWKRYRYRSPENVVEQLRILADTIGVRIVWFADENFSADQEATLKLLKQIIAADLKLSLNINMTAADVVRDREFLPLYKAAGVDYVVMGVESLEDDVIASVRKNNPFDISKEAMRLLREHHIISFTNIIYGLEEETLSTIAQKFIKLFELDSDIFNATYLTPHFWTAAGRATSPKRVIQHDMSKWTYRNQVIHTPHLAPWMLFTGIKLTEAFFHFRPKALLRLLVGSDWKVRRMLRALLLGGGRTVVAEIVEFLFDTQFEPCGTLERLPGTAHRQQILVDGKIGD